jgi:DNA-binding XRE family transcriptional regulator
MQTFSKWPVDAALTVYWSSRAFGECRKLGRWPTEAAGRGRLRIQPDIVTLRYMKRRDYETLRKHLAITIKAFRREHELSRERLSLEAELDRTYVSQIERSLGNTSLLVLAALANALGRRRRPPVSAATTTT